MREVWVPISGYFISDPYLDQILLPIFKKKSINKANWKWTILRCMSFWVCYWIHFNPWLGHKRENTLGLKIAVNVSWNINCKKCLQSIKYISKQVKNSTRHIQTGMWFFL